jgi:cytoskeletal protein RodZ
VAGVDLADPTTLVPELPASMGAALLQALNLNLNRRPPSIEAFLHLMGLTGAPADGLAATSRTVMVGEFGASAQSQATIVRIRSERVTVTPGLPGVRRGRRAGLWVVAGMVIAALTGTGIWLYQAREKAPADVAKAPAPSQGEVSTSLSPPSPSPLPALNTPIAEKSDITAEPDSTPSVTLAEPVSPSGETSTLDEAPVVTEAAKRDSAWSAYEKKRSPPEINTAGMAGSARKESSGDAAPKQPRDVPRRAESRGYTDKQRQAVIDFNNM